MTSNNQGAPVLIALGANIPSQAGTPAKTFHAALKRLEQAGLAPAGLSPFYETEAWPDASDPPFLNAVAAFKSRLQPIALLTLLHEVETGFGRKRSVPNAPRPLDLDLLDYDGQVEEGAVILPHPRIAQRRFVLEPLGQVAPGWRHPITGRTVDELLKAL
ncbi:MAG TPA: 2-amino-4-hydroxy-6-hydroxymethyldihydropteridine diphosphokinase [Rhizomicrobium sp.]|nr:2-amino-4-hydroxy-6-hydroxymethyldihydropteridine diphosphokinase [Rhizomicrobium sp.]